MTNLVFKTGMNAFEYAVKFFSKEKLSARSSYIGVVKAIDRSEPMEVYKVLILCKNGSMFSRKSTLMVAAIAHPELDAKIVEDDLVRFGVDQLKLKIPTGFILDKYSLELDVATGQFLPYQPPVPQKYRVIVRDHFHYMDEDETYVDGEYDAIDEAITASQRIVDDYLISRLNQGFSAEELYDDYMSFGDDPSIQGADWSAANYARAKAEQLVSENKKHLKNASVLKAQEIWWQEVSIKYGQLLPQSEIIEDEDNFYYCQTDRNQLIASWSKRNREWKIDIDRNQLDGLSFSTPRRFEEAVFGEENGNISAKRKQFLVEFLLYGLAKGEIKTVSKSLEDGSRIEFSIDYNTWNDMLIGNQVGLEGACRHLIAGNDEERILDMAMLCNSWNVTLEVVFGEYEDYEQLEFSIKEFGGFYT